MKQIFYLLLPIESLTGRPLWIPLDIVQNKSNFNFFSSIRDNGFRMLKEKEAIRKIRVTVEEYNLHWPQYRSKSCQETWTKGRAVTSFSNTSILLMVVKLYSSDTKNQWQKYLYGAVLVPFFGEPFSFHLGLVSCIGTSV